MGEKINILDVSARDGLQNEPRLVSIADKLTLIAKLVQAGVRDIQATSFVHPHWVPQMADAEALAAHFGEFPGVRFSALVPNVKGYERAVASGVRYLEFVLSASDTFNRKNLNRTLPESLALLEEVSRAAERDGVTIRTGISTSFHCPFEGTISAKALLAVVKASRERTPWRVAICDTDGMAFPDQVRDAVALVTEELELLQPNWRSISTTLMVAVLPTRSPGSMPGCASLMPPRLALVDARTAPERAAILPPKTWSRFCMAWAMKRGSISTNCAKRRSLPAALPKGIIKGICSAFIAPQSAQIG